MRSWSPGNGTLHLPESTWLLRVPLYSLTEAVLGSSTTTLALQTITLNVLAALMIFWFIHHTVSLVAAGSDTRTHLTDGWLAVLVTCWVITLSPVVVDNLMRPNLRNLEIGLVCVGLILASRCLRSATLPGNATLNWHRVASLAVPAVWFGVLGVSDATAMYCLVAPAAAVAAVLLVHRPSVVARDVLLMAVGGLVVWRLGLVILRLIGIETVSLNPRFIEAAELPTTMATTADSLANIFDIPLFGSTVGDLRLAVVVPQLILLVLSVFAIRRLRASYWRNSLALGAATWILGLLAAFMLSSHGLSDLNIRYLVFGVVPIAAIIAGGVAATDPRPRALMLALMTIVVAVHVVDAARSIRTASSPNADAARVVEALARADVQRGYGDFWETLGPSYFDRELTLVPVTCINGTRTAPRFWFVHDGISQPDPDAARTAFIVNDRPGLLPCGREHLTQQFGEPVETVQVTSLITLLIYEGDIGSNMDPAPPPG